MCIKYIWYTNTLRNNFHIFHIFLLYIHIIFFNSSIFFISHFHFYFHCYFACEAKILIAAYIFLTLSQLAPQLQQYTNNNTRLTSAQTNTMPILTQKRTHTYTHPLIPWKCVKIRKLCMEIFYNNNTTQVTAGFMQTKNFIKVNHQRWKTFTTTKKQWRL